MKHYHCPVNGWDCPYYKYKDNDFPEKGKCLCILENPYEECDDFFSSYGEDCNPNDYTDDTDDKE